MISRESGLSVWRSTTILLPLGTILLAVLIMPLPVSVKLDGHWLMPSFPLIAIYLWTLLRPELVPPITVLLSGLLMDLVIGAPLGISSLAFLAAYAITLSQRLYWITLPGFGQFVGFLLMMSVASLVAWLAVSFVHGRFVGAVPALLEIIVSALVFPIARRMFMPLARMAGPVG